MHASHRLNGTPKPQGDSGEAAAGCTCPLAASGTPLYTALPHDLACRLVHAAPLRTAEELQLGSLWAPTQ